MDKVLMLSESSLVLYDAINFIAALSAATWLEELWIKLTKSAFRGQISKQFSAIVLNFLIKVLLWMSNHSLAN